MGNIHPLHATEKKFIDSDVFDSRFFIRGNLTPINIKMVFLCLELKNPTSKFVDCEGLQWAKNSENICGLGEGGCSLTTYSFAGERVHSLRGKEGPLPRLFYLTHTDVCFFVFSLKAISKR